MDTQSNGRLAELLAKVESLQAENEQLHSTQSRCAEIVARLTDRVENQQSVIRELTEKLKQTSTYRKRPSVMRGRTVQSNVGCGPLYITLNEDDNGKPFEVFFKLGKSGSCQQSYLEALGVTMSVGLRYGADPQKFINKFEGMRCPNPKMRNLEGPTTLSCADGISQGLAKALALALPGTEPADVRTEASFAAIAEPKHPVNNAEQFEVSANTLSLDLIQHESLLGHTGNGHLSATAIQKAMQTGVGLCPKCSSPLINQGGCIQCWQQCGYTKCV